MNISYEYFWNNLLFDKDNAYVIRHDETSFKPKEKIFMSKDLIERVVFNNPATIVFWKDGTKTVVKCQDRDEYNKEHGLCMAICKKVFGNKGNFNDVINKWLSDDEVS